METEKEKAQRMTAEGFAVQRLMTHAAKSFIEETKRDLSSAQDIADAYARFCIECLASLILNGADAEDVRGMVNRSIDTLASARASIPAPTSRGGDA
jgi:hypothetical protein